MKIGFIHTSAVHIATFDTLCTEYLPDASVTHIVQESWLKQAIETELTEEIAQEVRDAVNNLANQSCDTVICTCSSIADIVESYCVNKVNTLRIDRPMADRAVKYNNILVLAALESILSPTHNLLISSAELINAQLSNVKIHKVKDAWSDFENHEFDRYNQKIADCINIEHDKFDIIVLAQASMKDAKKILPDNIQQKVLDSPTCLMEYLAAHNTYELRIDYNYSN